MNNIYTSFKIKHENQLDKKPILYKIFILHYTPKQHRTMKINFAILISFVLLNSISAQSDTRYLSSYFKFNPGSTEQIFANDVKFRKEPDTNSDVIDLLKIGTEIKIIEQSEQTQKFDGVESNWYKIEFNGKTGYVLGALISMRNLTTADNKNLYFQIKSDENDRIAIKIRHLLNETEYKEHIFNLIGYEFSVDLLANNGFQNVKNIIAINYLAEACGVEGGVSYIFWDGNDLKHIADLSSISEAGMFYYQEKFVFPNQPEGVNDKLVYEVERGTIEDEETNWVKTYKEKQEYGCTGTGPV